MERHHVEHHAEGRMKKERKTRNPGLGDGEEEVPAPQKMTLR